MTVSLRSIFRTYRRLDLPAGFAGRNEWSSRRRYLLTAGFGGRFAPAALRLTVQAKACGWFDEVFCLDERSELFGIGEFLATTRQLREQHPKGFGLWSWKPYLVGRALAHIEEGAHLYYIDAGCELSAFGESRLKELDARVAEKGAVFFALPFLERDWTKPELLERFSVPGLAETAQVQATWFALANTATVRQLAAKWWDEASREQFAALLDPDTATRQGAQHRHDQSVLSCVVKSWQPPFHALPWEDVYAPWLYARNSRILLEPVHALRNGSGVSVIGPIVRQSRMQSCLDDMHGDHASLSPARWAHRAYHWGRDELMLLVHTMREIRGR